MRLSGFVEIDFADLADLIAEIVAEGDEWPAGHWAERVAAFRARFTEMKYCLG